MTCLQDVCHLITDGKHGDCENEDGSGYYFVSCKDVNDGWIDYTGARQITEHDFVDTHKRTQLQPNDILITNSGTIGRMALVPNIPEVNRTTFQKSVAIIKPNTDTVLPSWLYYCLIAKKDLLVARAGGTAQKNLLLRDLRAFELVVPPLSTQLKIASILSAYDDLIENNTKRIKILEEMAQTIYNEWFVKFKFPGHENVKMVDSELGMIPEEWEVKTLGDVATQSRRSVNPNLIDSNTPYFGLEHLPCHSIALSEWGMAAEVTSLKYTFNRNEILFGKIRPYFHKVGVPPVEGICSSDIVVITVKDNLFLYIVLGCVSSDEFVAHAVQTSNGTKMPRANWDVLTKYPLFIPPTELILKYNEFFKYAVEQIHNFILRNHNLKKTRDLLLPRLISGEVDVSTLDINVEEITA